MRTCQFNVKLLASIRGYIDALVHPSARPDPLTAARHRAFIGSRILCGLLALGAFPIYLAINGVPSLLEAAFFVWLLLPLANAHFLSRTGRYETAHVIASFVLTGLVTLVAGATGGVRSFAAVWLIVVPAEAAFATSRRVVFTAALFVALAVGLLLSLEWMDMLPAPRGPQPFVFAALGIFSAALFATGVALRAQGFARAASRRLRGEEMRYRLLARNMTDVITRHGRKGAVLFASPAAESVFGVPPRRLLGHGLFDRIHVGDRPAYLSALADAATGRGMLSVEFRVRCGAERRAARRTQFAWIEMRCRALERDGAEGDCEVVAVMRDVTERKAQQETLEQARREAERANAAKSRFLATISHELRTPLNAIIGFSEMLTKEEQLDIGGPQRQHYAQLINDSGHHLLSVVNGLLDMSKIETGRFELVSEPFAPGPVFSGCCDLLALKARDAGVDLVVRVGPLPEIVADKRAFKQILLNLVSNAIKFTNRGGRVTVTAEPGGASLLMTVADTGVGIGESDLARLGDPFFQARDAYTRAYDGTGLGLSIVKGLVALHGGSLDITSRLGEGTTVAVRLPLDCERAPPAPPSNVAALPAAAARHPADQQVRKRA